MDSVLVLIAAPGSGAINANLTDMLRDFGAGLPRWLAAAEALEVDDFAARTQFMEAIAGLPVDANVVPLANRRKRLLIADMDSTMIEQECIDELGVMAGIGEHIKQITARAMRGELDFEGALTERVKLLKGLPAAIIDTILRERISFMAGGRTLIATMKAHGAHTALVLPPGGAEVLSRELVYTGITRARTQFTLVEAEAGLLEAAVARPGRRASGLQQWWGT